jgi:hypothetical protein
MAGGGDAAHTDALIMRRPFSFLVAAVIGIAIHLDWHVGRQGHHSSLGWSQHWLLAIPVFAWSAWHVVGGWRNDVIRTSVTSLAGGVLLGQGLEPLYERVVDQWPFAQSFGPERIGIFTAFMLAGLLTYVLAAWLLTRRVSPRHSVPTL